MKRPPRVPSRLPELLHHRLNAYALAASAAGVGVLALAQSAEAKIVYTPTHQIIKSNSKYNLDLNNDGITDFVIVDRFGCGSRSRCGSLSVAAGTGASAVTKHPGFGGTGPYALRRGVTVGASQDWSRGGTLAVDNSLQGGTFNSEGKWASVTNRYLGLRIVVNHERHYGWARMTVKIDSKTGAITALLTGYAYETTANKAIIAGKTKGPDKVEKHGSGPGVSLTNPIPETRQPTSLGALAVGASGLSTWRRQESVGATRRTTF